ncbi:vWA domain-containing protein [Oceanobacter mangrovi]|uniref:vWA domain-containing protein n=1 Tax=Oceanobacter mangrovi TaxID=2862510 RepID=UPI001C8E6B27|nr:vWA domain-containing protein [Oceanobacter mangrovi]
MKKGFSQTLGSPALLALPLAFTLLVSGCDDSANPGQTTMANSSFNSQPKQPPAAAYGARGTDNSWPKVAQGSPAALDSEQMLQANYLLLIDGSGSMGSTECSDRGTRLDAAKRAALSFMTSVPTDANVGIYAFDQAGMGPRLGLGHYNQQQLAAALNKLVAGAGTPLKTSIRESAGMLTEQAIRQLGYGEYHLVIVTDGLPSDGEAPDNVITKLNHTTPINIHTIGFCIGKDHPLNQPGITAYYQANDEKSLTAGLEAVVAEAPSFDVTSFSDGGSQ